LGNAVSFLGKTPKSLQKATKTYQLSSFEKCGSLLQQHL